MTTIAKKYSVRPLAMVNATDTASVSGVVSNGLRADAAVSCRPVSCCATPDGNGVMVTATVTLAIIRFPINSLFKFPLISLSDSHQHRASVLVPCSLFNHQSTRNPAC